MMKEVNIQRKEEESMIIKAMGLSAGQWYQCPNGHPYVIGECGGAMELSKCNECQATIGGVSHSLVGNNSQASQFAGQSRPAWDPENEALNIEVA